MDLMLDLETLGTNPDCPVISIGAVLFEPETGKIRDTFYIVLDINEQIERGRKVTGDTLKWWMEQSEAAQKVFKDEAKPVDVALAAFLPWIRNAGGTDVSNLKVWGNGATFDVAIMENLLQQYKTPIHWKFWNIMDLRTFKRFNSKGRSVEKTGVNHNALDDAIAQANFVIECLKQ